ncbi:hypothetical protein A2783_05215 [Microgenomates group bacterium RIFCSPHIGHO2_01_FULL_45_11]|nr:MAG: hypothetical protein A2783_05215 [Microgenomates group bacterium RIFCSPHIGHO2_01_FULL_45_11]
MKSLSDQRISREEVRGGVRIVPLGGMGTVTRNMFVYETDSQILLVDCGIGFPEYAAYGIDILLPDISYLEDKREKIVGMLLTHGHDDHIAGLPYILPQLPPFPIYTSKLTGGFVLDRCKDFEVAVDIRELPDGEFRVGEFAILPIKVTHSIPDGRHFVIAANGSTIYHGADFKFDSQPVDGVRSDLDRIRQAGEKGVTLLLSDCLRAERKGTSASESRIRATLEREIKTARGKFIVTVMSSNIHRIQQAIDVMEADGRTVAFLGRSIEQNVVTAARLGFLRLPKQIVNKRKIGKIPAKKLGVVIAGSQGQEGSSLVRASVEEHELIEIKPEDKVVFSTEPIPGRELDVNRAIDNIARLGADLAYSDADDEMHVSGHASAEEIKELIRLSRPRFLAPIGGSFRHMRRFWMLAAELGYQPDQVFLWENGQTLVVKGNEVTWGKEVKLAEVAVDGLGIGDVGAVVLADRKRMAENGIVEILILVDAKRRQVIGEPEVVTRGLVYVKQSKALLKLIAEETKRGLPRAVTNEQWGKVKSGLEKRIADFIYTEIQREPLILPVIRQV